MILAAGLGTRLYPLTCDRTKPAVPFLNKPIVAFSVEYLKLHGITDIVVNLHHQPDSVRRALGDGSQYGVNITYSYEPEILGTAGGLDKVRDFLSDDDFVVINGKLITDINLAEAIETHRNRGAIGTMVLRRNAKREHYSNVEIDTNGDIVRFAGFPEALPDTRSLQDEIKALRAVRMNKAGDHLVSVPAKEEDLSAPLMFASIHIMSPKIFNYIPRGVVSDSVRDTYPAAMADGKRVTSYIGRGYWYEFSTLRRYLDISLEFLHREGRANCLGTNSEIEPGALVTDCVLWNRVRVERDATLRRCIIGDDVVIPADTHMEDLVVVRADRVGDIERGTKSGDNIVVPIG